MKQKIEWRIGGEWGEFATLDCSEVHAILIVWCQMKAAPEDGPLANRHNWRVTEVNA